MIDAEQIKIIEHKIGYTFSDKRLLVNALTHSSYSYERGGENNEKLEFLGDSILNFLVAEKLYLQNVSNEGDMTVMRSKMVSRKPLAYAVAKLDLLKYLRIGGGLKRNELSLKTRSNIFESVLAAIYLDSGLEQCKKFIFDNLDIERDLYIDYKSAVQEYVQANKKGGVLRYEDILINKDNACFETRLYLDEIEMGVGQGSKKKEAQQEAAKQMYLKLGLK